jgi:hypothetical protein
MPFGPIFARKSLSSASGVRCKQGINHDILSVKLERYGFRGHSLNFINSYLSNRRQFTCVNGVNSSTSSINYGVPQGSVLGPLLFLLYVNDIQFCLGNNEVRLFADDTAIFFHHRDFNELITISAEKCKSIFLWFESNKVAISSEKSNFLIFKKKNRKNPNLCDKLIFEDHCIPRAGTFKYIGLVLDENLSWDHHVDSVIKSLHAYFDVFYNLRKFMDKKLFRIAYYSCVFSRIKYGLEVYGSCRKSLLNKVQITQNKLLRVLLTKDRMYSSNLLHKELDIFKVKHTYEQFILYFVHDCLHGKAIETFTDYFTPIPCRTYNTRQGGLLYKRQIKTELGRSSTYFTGATLWNSLPNNIRSIENQKTFKKAVRSNHRTLYNQVT